LHNGGESRILTPVTTIPWPGLGPDEFDALSSRSPRVLRSDRYRGTGQAVRLADLGAEQRTSVLRLYEHLQGLYELWRRSPAKPDWPELARRTLAIAESDLVDRVRALWRGAEAADPAVHRVLHDLRGGATTAFLAEAELLQPGLRKALDAGTVGREGLETMIFLARDQAKIMRNGLIDLDPEQRARDTEENPHHLDDLVVRWGDVDYRTFDGRVRVRAESDAPAILSSCCLEFGCIDRIVYNLVNIAARHAADGEVALQARVEPTVVLIAVTNRVAGEQADWLARTLEHEPGALFRSGTTRRGSGLGLGIVGDFVAAAFSLGSTDQAVAEEYLGATRLGDRLAVWFHWPVYAGAADA